MVCRVLGGLVDTPWACFAFAFFAVLCLGGAGRFVRCRPIVRERGSSVCLVCEDTGDTLAESAADQSFEEGFSPFRTNFFCIGATSTPDQNGRRISRTPRSLLIPSSLASIEAACSNGWQTRLKSHEDAFQGLLSLIPSKLYYAQESQVPPSPRSKTHGRRSGRNGDRRRKRGFLQRGPSLILIREIRLPTKNQKSRKLRSRTTRRC